MIDKNSSEDGQKAEIFEPEDPKMKKSPDGQTNISIEASFAEFTNRPDLMIEVLEKFDPGFVRRMNEMTFVQSERSTKINFRYGGIQAYTSLIISVLMAFGIFGLIAYLVIYGEGKFLTIIALVVFYAVTQGGMSAFHNIADGIISFLHKFGSKKN